MEISPLCGRTLFSKDETSWHIKEEFVIDSVLKYYSASSLPYSQEKHILLLQGAANSLHALSFHVTTVLEFVRVFLSVGTNLLGMLNLFYPSCLVYFL